MQLCCWIHIMICQQISFHHLLTPPSNTSPNTSLTPTNNYYYQFRLVEADLQETYVNVNSLTPPVLYLHLPHL